jgi:DNA-directed RNA polymerase sigma subunit (sigma70/sigma32)
VQVVEGKKAVQHLVRSNIRLVLSIAKKYRSDFVDYSDLIQASATARAPHGEGG